MLKPEKKSAYKKNLLEELKRSSSNARLGVYKLRLHHYLANYGEKKRITRLLRGNDGQEDSVSTLATTATTDELLLVDEGGVAPLRRRSYGSPRP